MSVGTNRVWRTLTTVVATGLLMASCSNSRDATDIRLVIGVAQANLSEPWREVMNAEILETAREYPGLRIVFTNAGDSRATQESDIDKLMRSGIDLLIVSPVESQEMAPAIREARATITRCMSAWTTTWLAGRPPGLSGSTSETPRERSLRSLAVPSPCR